MCVAFAEVSESVIGLFGFWVRAEARAVDQTGCEAPRFFYVLNRSLGRFLRPEETAGGRKELCF